MGASQPMFRKSRRLDPAEVETQLASLTAALRSADEERRRLEVEVNQLRTTAPVGGSIDHVGQEVASVLRTFAQTVGQAKEDAETRAGQIIAEAQAAATDLRQTAEREAQRLRIAAQDAHDQGVQGLEVSRVEARRVWEEARATADTILNDARDEANGLLEQARAGAEATTANAEARTARIIGDSQAAANEVRDVAEHDAAKLRADAQRAYADSIDALETARQEARRLIDEARTRAELLAADAESRAAARITALFDRARDELQQLQQARIGALRTLESSEDRLREVARHLRSLGELEVNLLTAEVAETQAPIGSAHGVAFTDPVGTDLATGPVSPDAGGPAGGGGGTIQAGADRDESDDREGPRLFGRPDRALDAFFDDRDAGEGAEAEGAEGGGGDAGGSAGPGQAGWSVFDS